MENNISERDVAEFAESFPLSEALRGKSIAITGATGLLGACMVRCLLALNKYRELHLRVLAVIRNREKAVEILGNECKELGFYCHDFARNEAFAPDERIDYLLHFAAPTASRSFVDQPVEVMNTVYDGMRNILSYARGHRLKSIVLASTLEVYGTITDDSRPLTESDQGYLDPMAARSSYPLAKRAAEGLCTTMPQSMAYPSRWHDSPKPSVPVCRKPITASSPSSPEASSTAQTSSCTPQASYPDATAIRRMPFRPCSIFS